MIEEIRQNIERIRMDLPEDVTLLVVSKTRSVEEILEAYSCGERDFGENKVQELLEKKALLPEDIRWHMIGGLQSNKARKITGEATLIHSLDRPELAKALDRSAMKKGITVDVLVEVNIGEETSKSGVHEKDLQELLDYLESCAHIRVRGLMAVIPQGDRAQNLRYFNRMKQLFEQLKPISRQNFSMEILSMGMTGDYKEAIEAGSSMIRVGEGIFGKRDYQKS